VFSRSLHQYFHVADVHRLLDVLEAVPIRSCRGLRLYVSPPLPPLEEFFPLQGRKRLVLLDCLISISPPPQDFSPALSGSFAKLVRRRTINKPPPLTPPTYWPFNSPSRRVVDVLRLNPSPPLRSSKFLFTFLGFKSASAVPTGYVFPLVRPPRTFFLFFFVPLKSFPMSLVSSTNPKIRRPPQHLSPFRIPLR